MGEVKNDLSEYDRYAETRSKRDSLLVDICRDRPCPIFLVVWEKLFYTSSTHRSEAWLQLARMVFTARFFSLLGAVQ